ncbi:MAG TPA: RDD family protein, partial [Chitinophagaceae bacterium]|nr:RDD family protein [Chitinophagaceae bacterium]
ATIGNLIKGIRVRRVNDVQRPINIFQAFIRYITKTLLGWLSFITIHSNRDKRAIHDLAAGSVMVRKN